MFEYLKKIDDRLYDRYLTVERNIKSASNSFYDSYLDMLETFIRIVAYNNNLVEEERISCGMLLHNEKLKNIFVQDCKIEENIYEKLLNYTKKANEHKHNNEKKIQVDTIINQLTVFFEVTSKYYVYNGGENQQFIPSKIIAIFGVFEKENSQLKEEVTKLKEDLSASIESGKIKESDIAIYKNLLSQAELDKLSLEDQNNELQKQVSKLKDIKLSSMEEKLNRTIDLLNELTASVVENRAVSYAVGDTICGRDLFGKYVEKAKNDMSQITQNTNK